MYYYITNYRIPRRIKVVDKIIEIDAETIYLSFDDIKIYLLPVNEKNCFFIVKTEERNFAYKFYSLLRGFYLLFYHESPWSIGDKMLSIYEYDRMPKESWTKREWIENSNSGIFINISDNVLIDADLRMGLEYFNDGEYHLVQRFVKDNWYNIIVIDAVDDLFNSLKLFDGNVVNNYPIFDIRDTPRKIDNEIIDKAYYENKSFHELAYLCAFKGIERILDTNSINKKKISEILSSNRFLPKEEYIKEYMYFVDNLRESTIENMIRLFIDIRNAAAAHANNNVPIEKRVSVYSLYEIQNFLMFLIKKRIK